MMMKKHLIFLGMSLLLLSCNKKKFFAGPNSFSDSFESYSNFEELLIEGDVNWSYANQTYDNNSITLSTQQVHSGTTSLKFDAVVSTDEKLSKCSLTKQNMAFFEGETVKSEIWYYIEGEQELDWLFLLDLEEQTAVGAGPGIRVANAGTENYGVVEFKFKFQQGNLLQEDFSFPRNQWFKITFETLLSQKKKGWVKLYLDDQLIIEEKETKTLPKDLLYNLQGTKAMYTSIEIGITANSFSNNTVLYADDFSIEVIN